jgi:IS5 family transposase
MQHWYNLSDGAMEDALYEIASMRLFARLSWIAPCRMHQHDIDYATCSSSINWPVNCSRPSIAGWPKQAS